MCIYIYIYIYICICVRACFRARMRVYVCVCRCVYVCLCLLCVWCPSGWLRSSGWPVLLVEIRRALDRSIIGSELVERPSATHAAAVRCWKGNISVLGLGYLTFPVISLIIVLLPWRRCRNFDYTRKVSIFCSQVEYICRSNICCVFSLTDGRSSRNQMIPN